MAENRRGGVIFFQDRLGDARRQGEFHLQPRGAEA